MTRHLLVVETNCAAGTDAEFNRWYDAVHIPELLTITGFIRATRYRLAPAQMGRSAPVQRYLALYEIDADDPQDALDAIAAKAPELDMSPTLLTGPGEMRLTLYTSIDPGSS